MHEDEVAGPAGYGVLVLRDVGGGWVVVEGNEGDDWVVEHPTYGTVRLDGDEIEGDTRAIGVKNVTYNDMAMQGHYPGQPIFPGVLIVEALAQLGGILLSQKLEHTGKLAVLLSMDKVKMRHPVVPGDQLVLEAEVDRIVRNIGKFRCRATVDHLLDFTLAAKPADGEDRRAVHREQQGCSIEERDGEHMERVVEQIAVAQREGCRPVQVREDAERNRLTPPAHHDGADKS